ncbi:hypothetical protein [Halobacteriovorax sp. HLS]|uniref:c-type cytochrome n=1 Tax=Halobacteriovorax sp. HLS TaxID=2234000 RepID=UPI000FDBC67D|nr:hypothetical protein [Halobacteriovorax sp. HLS]
MSKILFFLLALIFPLFSYALDFSLSAKKLVTLDLVNLKKVFKIHKVSVFNPYIKKSETFNAFYMPDILNHIYTGKESWQKSFAFEVDTLTGYRPIVETYKFSKRNSYLAFEKDGGLPFVSIDSYRESAVDLSPFYLIWIEDRKKVPSRRRIHWVSQIKSFNLINSYPVEIIPGSGSAENITWGYKNVRKHCLACHTVYGVGSQKDGELITSEILSSYTDELLYKLIDRPRSVKESMDMPIFSPKIDLRSKRIRDIISYLRYLERLKPTEANRKKHDKLLKSLESVKKKY